MTKSRQSYFTSLQDALVEAGIAQPVLVIDRAALDRNIDRLVADLPDGMALRIVAKSLPSPDLLRHITERAGTKRLMTFNIATLTAFMSTLPDAEHLMGKPLPSRGVKTFLEQHLTDPSLGNIQWLVDTPDRVRELAAIARELSLQLRVNFELNVGLQRGGFSADQDLRRALKMVRDSSELRFAGTMGYEAHLSKIPEELGVRANMDAATKRDYSAAVNMIAEVLGPQVLEDATRNAAGSPTYSFWQDTEIANEVSVGSLLVKPTDFDLPHLDQFEPASFIATPVLKVQDETQLPGPPLVLKAMKLAGKVPAKSVFIHGGNWLAKPHFPDGLEYSSFFGRSSNQEMLHGPKDLSLKVDDFVFLRPTQSEAVFTHLGDVAVFDGEQFVDTWKVLAPSG